MDQLLSREEIKAFRELGLSFAKKTILPIFEGDFPDGDLSQAPQIMEKAFEIGLATSPDEDIPGFTHGIWGSAIDEAGLGSSLMLLSIIAEVCGGIAMNLHAQGIAVSVLIHSKNIPANVPKRVALAIQEEFGLPSYGTMLSPDKDLPAHIITTATPTKDGYNLNGTKSFVYGMDKTEAFIVFARIKKDGSDEWGCFLVPASTKGLNLIPAGRRTGLRACELCHLEFGDASVPRTARLDNGDALNLLKHGMCLNWIGISAIASGIAKGSVEAAKKYASQRYQGGDLIENHPAIQMLIAGAESRASAAYAIVSQLSQIDLGNNRALRQCAMAKLITMELSAMAATDSLQTFGGYGYMEDYGMEKRLRDVTVLKSAAGSPLYLKRFIFEADKEETR